MARHVTPAGILASLVIVAALPQDAGRREGAARTGGQEVPASADRAGHEAFEDPKSCRSCHPLVYARWSRGMHRYSFEDPIFQVAYTQVYTETSGKAAGTCLRCHAPAAHAAGDPSVEQPVHRLGVQCDFCHSVEAVDLAKHDAPFRLRRGSAKAAPHTETTNDKHGTWHQPLLTSSRFCAGCHEYVVEGGVHLISTYSEWEAGPYAEEGRTCQSCHMPTLQRVAYEDGSVREINDHDLSGGHSSEQIRKAGRISIDSVEREGESCTVVVTVENVGSGHHLPTGMPSRQVILEVELRSGSRLIGRDHRSYRKVVADKDGIVLTTDADIKWRGRRIVSDNRLRPREPRREVFHFRVSPLVSFEVDVTLSYVYLPLLLKPERIRVRMGGGRRFVARDG